MSLCAISLIHKDKQLGDLVVKELIKFEKDPNQGHHVAFMIAQFYIQNVRIQVFSQSHSYLKTLLITENESRCNLLRTVENS